jgi:hypothetical protein
MKTLTNRHGHLEGFCSLRFFPGADHKIVTCGADSLVKVHNLDEVDDDGNGVADIDHFEKPVHAVAVRRDGALIAAGGEDREVSLFDSSSFEFMKNVARCTLSIRDLCFSPVSSALAVASDDENIMIVNTEDTSEVKTLKGHRGGVKSLAYDPKGKYLASTGTDCTLRVWDVETEAEKKRYDKVFPTSSGAATNSKQVPVNLCNIAWSHDGTLLAVAGNPEIKVFARDSWEEKDAFIGGSQKDVSCVAFSPNGLYLLSVDTAGLVTVWDVGTRESITRYENPAGSKITYASWDPVLNSIALIAEDGSYGIVMDVVPSDRLGPSEMLDEEEDAESFGVGGEDEDELNELSDSPKHKPREGKASRVLTTRAAYEDEEAVERQPSFQPQVINRTELLSYILFSMLENPGGVNPSDSRPRTSIAKRKLHAAFVRMQAVVLAPPCCLWHALVTRLGNEDASALAACKSHSQIPSMVVLELCILLLRPTLFVESSMRMPRKHRDRPLLPCLYST